MVFGPYGDSIEITATVDTGFTGCLMLPERNAHELRLHALQDLEVVLADGSVTRLNQYDAEIEWDSRRRGIPVYASKGEAIVGSYLA